MKRELGCSSCICSNKKISVFWFLFVTVPSWISGKL